MLLKSSSEIRVLQWVIIWEMNKLFHITTLFIVNEMIDLIVPIVHNFALVLQSSCYHKVKIPISEEILKSMLILILLITICFLVCVKGQIFTCINYIFLTV